MRVIYIAGTSHSGSTLLDLMLNAHPAILAAGEVLKLNRQLTIRKSRKGTPAPCSCGAVSLWECPFWSAVDRRTQEISGKSLTDLDMLDYRDEDGASAPNAVVFKAVAEASGKNFVVDSSKLPGRLSYLMRLTELDVYPVHLVREPKGQINSVARKHGGFLKHIFRYELVHEQLRRILNPCRIASCITKIWCAIPRAPCRASCSRSGSISIRASSIGPRPRSTRSPAITCASMRRKRSRARRKLAESLCRSSNAPSTSARCFRARRCPRLAPCANKVRRRAEETGAVP